MEAILTGVSCAVRSTDDNMQSSSICSCSLTVSCRIPALPSQFKNLGLEAGVEDTAAAEPYNMAQVRDCVSLEIRL